MIPYSLKHLIKSSKTTKYQEEFNKQFEQIMHIERCLKETIKSIRRFTDPNSKFTLMSSFIGENKMSDVDLFSDCLLRMNISIRLLYFRNNYVIKHVNKECLTP
ncbi:hypothetical protein T4B_6003 [Trichinella pseudospiralis]|uniref:Uncharacterized protein n=1 Tax=Trichinella pseudospiralis TaxID=6337 RepID=A0A0V1JHS4_TRIPS|nr:hypothetical protein T4B_6003 [Trichinella pseudospiralis]